MLLLARQFLAWAAFSFSVVNSIRVGTGQVKHSYPGGYVLLLAIAAGFMVWQRFVRFNDEGDK